MLLVLITGCGEERKFAPVTGQVLLDGQPVADVLVHFQPHLEAPKQGQAPDAVDSSGVTNAEGKFELRLADTDKPGALVGKHQVRFSDRRATADQDGGPTPMAPKSRFAARYSDSTQEFEVPAEGTDKANFQLTSR